MVVKVAERLSQNAASSAWRRTFWSSFHSSFQSVAVIEKKQLEMAAADQSDYLVLTAMQEEIADFETQIEALELEWFEAAEKLGE